MSQQIGDILRKEGIDPVYRPVGYYTYDMSFSKRKNDPEVLAAPVFEVNGDTRLKYVLEKLTLQQWPYIACDIIN